MTRINLGVKPSELCNKHLLAEHREIKRIPNIIKSSRFSLENIPKHFTLGTGHVKFFYDKLLFLKNRYISIHNECIRRGLNVADYSSSFDGLPKELMHSYALRKGDRNIIVQRINQKLYKMNEESKWFLNEQPMSNLLFTTHLRYGILDRLYRMAQIINEKKDCWVMISYGIEERVQYHVYKADDGRLSTTIYFSKAIQIQTDFSRIRYVEVNGKGWRIIENNEDIKINLYDTIPAEAKKQLNAFLNAQERDCNKELKRIKQTRELIKEI